METLMVLPPCIGIYKEVAFLLGSGINGNVVVELSEKCIGIVAFLLGSGINGN